MPRQSWAGGGTLVSKQKQYTAIEILLSFLGYLGGDEPENNLDFAVREAIRSNPQLDIFAGVLRKVLIRIAEIFHPAKNWVFSVCSPRIATQPISPQKRTQILSCPGNAEAIVLDNVPWALKTILLFDRHDEKVWFNGHWITLPRRQFSILYAILRNVGQIRMEVLCEEVTRYDGIIDGVKVYSPGAAQMAIKSLVITMRKYGPFEIKSVNKKFCINTDSFLLIDYLA